MATKLSFQELISSDQLVLVDFYADWCGPCQMLQPVLKELASRKEGQVRVVKIDVEKNPALALNLKIQGVPTLMLFRKGKILWRQAGMLSLQQLEHIVDAHRPTVTA